MKALLSVAVSLLALTVATAQPAPAPSVSSALLGVPMPPGATLSRSFLYRGAARMSLQLEAKKRGLTLGEPLEVFKVPLDAPWQAEFVATLQGAGWSVRPDAADAQLVISERAGASFLLEFVASRRDRYIYVNALTQAVGAPVIAATDVGAAPPTAAQPSPGEPPPQPAPATQPTQPPPTPAPQPAPPAPAAAVDVAAPAVQQTTNGGFQFTTTTFTDGWVTTDEADYVKAVRGPITAYLFRRVPFTEQMRPPVIDVEDYFWQRDVVPRYDVTSIDRRRADLQYSTVAYIEGDVTERATGRRVYLGMNVHRSPGGGLNIVIVAPSRSEYLQAYPTPESLESALGVNKFAVGAPDVTGDWSESSATGIDMFYTSTGAYAGTNSTATSDQFTFNADGTYTSKHAGMSGMTGSARAYSQKHAGRWSMNGTWELTLTNRYEGASETFAVYFESVRGGRVLHLQNVRASGVRYHLGKVR